MRIHKTLGILVLLALALAVTGVAADQSMIPAGVKVAEAGIFTDANGMTLYTFDKDAQPGNSVCNGPCAQNWPPLAASAEAEDEGDWTIVTRDDGSLQWAYKDKPLYKFVKDSKPGETVGDGFLNNAWHVAKP